MSAEKKIKLQAKNVLKNNYTSALIAFFCSLTAYVLATILASTSYTVVECLFEEIFVKIDFMAFSQDYTYMFTNLAYYFTLAVLLPLTLPLNLGVLKYFYNLTKTGESNLNVVFYYLGKRFFKALSFCFGFFLRCFFRAIIPLVPGIVSYIVISALTGEKDRLVFSDHLWYFISYALLILGAVLALKFCSKYFLSPFIFFEEEDIKSSDLWREAKTAIKPMKKSVNKLISSVSPMFLLCIFVIPIIYVIPYILTCFSISAKWILELKNASKEE